VIATVRTAGARFDDLPNDAVVPRRVTAAMAPYVRAHGPAKRAGRMMRTATLAAAIQRDLLRSDPDRTEVPECLAAVGPSRLNTTGTAAKWITGAGGSRSCQPGKRPIKQVKQRGAV
jgi:hypothetical protein